MFLPKVKRKGRTFIAFRIKELNSVGGGGLGKSSTKVWRLGRDLASVIEQQPNGWDHSEQDGYFLAAVDRKNTHHAKVLISCDGLTVTPYTVVVKYEKSSIENVLFFHSFKI